MKQFSIYIAVFICIWNVLAAQNAVIMKFKSTIYPSKNQEGIVITGIPVLDSLNVKYECRDCDLIDFEWSTRLRNILVLNMPDDVSSQEVVSEYKICSELCYYIEAESKPEVDYMPGDYLLSNGLLHEDDIFELVGENPDKRYWTANMSYSWVTWNNSSSGSLNNVTYPLFAPFVTSPYQSLIPNCVVGGYYDDQGIHKYFGYSYKVFGKMGAWHHSSGYNNTLNAWDYTKGKDVGDNSSIVVVSDYEGFKPDHPDLDGQFLPTFQYIDVLGQTKTVNPLPAYLTSPVTHEYMYSGQPHGTLVAGAIAAKAEENSQNGIFNNLSSVGIAPEVKLLRTDPSVTGVAEALDYLITSGLIARTKAVSFSYPFYPTSFDYSNPNLTAEAILQDYIDHGVVPVLSRGYGRNTRDYTPYFTNSHIIVGDYAPSFRTITKYDIDTNNADESKYRVDINAPGMIWSTSFFPVVPDPGVTLNTGDAALGLFWNTSAAAPQVAGAVALIGSMYPWMSAPELKRQIMVSGRNLDLIVAANQAENFLPNTPVSFLGAGCLDVMGAFYLHGSFERDFLSSDNHLNTLLIGKDFDLINSDMVISSNGILRVQKNSSITIDNCNVSFADGSTIILEDNATLTFGASTQVTFGENVTIKSEDDSQPGTITFNQDFALSECTVLDCLVIVNEAAYTIDNSEITNTRIETDNCTNDIQASTISFCHINLNYSSYQQGMSTTFNDNTVFETHSQTINGTLAITGCMNTWITNNLFDRMTRAIYISYSSAYIYDNEIKRCTSAGLYTYASSVMLNKHNNIYDNSVGVAFTNYSAPAVIGATDTPYQRVINNDLSEMIFTPTSAPSVCNYTYLYDENNPDDIVINCTSAPRPNTRPFDFRYNYWGTSFDPSVNLHLQSYFSYSPTWSGSKSSTDSLTTFYLDAMNDEELGNYLDAKAKYIMLLNPNTPENLLKGAISRLYSLTSFVDNDYAGYANTISSLGLNDELPYSAFARYYQNYANLPQGNYISAITYYEDIIDNPPSTLDSLYAVVDAAYAYLLMSETGQKYKGRHPWLDVKNWVAFANVQGIVEDYILKGTLPEVTNDTDVPPALTYSIYPNPAKDYFEINSFDNTKGPISISIFNIRGQRVKSLNCQPSQVSLGTLRVPCANDSGYPLASGVYFVKINQGNQQIVRKMVVCK